MLDFVDHCSWDGAHLLAERIRDHWLGQVVTRIEKLDMASLQNAIFVVRSDMVNGLPVKREGP